MHCCVPVPAPQGDGSAIEVALQLLWTVDLGCPVTYTYFFILYRLMYSKKHHFLYNLQRLAVTMFCQKIIPHSPKTSDYPSYSPEAFNKNILTGIS